jgi:hypothetical protein
MMTASDTTNGMPSLRERSIRKAAAPFLVRLFHAKSPEMKNINAMKKLLRSTGGRSNTRLGIGSMTGAVEWT